MRADVEFRTSDGTVLRGWHYRPDLPSSPFPTVVMAHGLSAVKEMYLDRYAEVFANAGFAVLVYDHRNLGASDGEPRQEIDPWQQIRDWSDAITFALSLPDTDGERLGIWGSSYAGGHVLVVGAIDRRVKCVVSQVPTISGWANGRRLIRADQMSSILAMLAEDRRHRAAGLTPATMPMVSEDPAAACVLPTADSFDWFMGTHKARAPRWRNEMTLRSIEYSINYEPGDYVAKISPTPLLMIVALKDCLNAPDLALTAYERALHPKQLVLFPGGHFDAYVTEFTQSSEPARAWFAQHLRGG